MTPQLPVSATPPAASPPPGPGPATTATPRGTPKVVWLLVLLIISVAGAGLILSVDHAPTEEGRPELTARGHAIVAPRLAALDMDLQQLAETGNGIAAAGRDTLTRLRALDVARTQSALEAGDTAVADGSLALDRIVQARSTLLDGTSLTSLPAADRVQIGTIDTAIAAAGQLPDYWALVQVAGAAPLELLQVLDAHDSTVVTATDSGRAGEWSAALAALDDAQGHLRQAHAVRDTAHKAGLDVSTLDDLLDRLDTYDAALVDLYTILDRSNGETTSESRAALERVNAAQESLPTDQAAMVIVISDLAGPTITPVLLSIESARGALEAAVDAAPQPSDAAPPASLPSAGTSPVPVASGPKPSDGVSS